MNRTISTLTIALAALIASLGSLSANANHNVVRVHIPIHEQGPETLKLRRLIRHQRHIDLDGYRLRAVIVKNGPFSNGYANLRVGDHRSGRVFLPRRERVLINAPGRASRDWRLRLGPGTQVRMVTAVLEPRHRRYANKRSHAELHRHSHGYYHSRRHGGYGELAWTEAELVRTRAKLAGTRARLAGTRARLSGTRARLEQSRKHNKRLKHRKERLSAELAHRAERDRADRPERRARGERRRSNDQQQRDLVREREPTRNADPKDRQRKQSISAHYPRLRTHPG